MTSVTVRAVTAAALAALSLAPTTQASAVVAQPAELMTLADAISRLPLAPEAGDGYVRTAFKQWVDDDRDHCDTRAEVLIAESRTDAVITGACQVTAGTWYSYYDGKTVTKPRTLDIDHMVPLAEAWASGASQWSADRREDYANDLSADRSLVAVTAATNRSKGDRDPAQWLPPRADAYCTYAADWVATKLRWSLSADRAEINALRELAGGCGHQQVEEVDVVKSAEGAG